MASREGSPEIVCEPRRSEGFKPRTEREPTPAQDEKKEEEAARASEEPGTSKVADAPSGISEEPMPAADPVKISPVTDPVEEKDDKAKTEDDKAEGGEDKTEEKDGEAGDGSEGEDSMFEVEVVLKVRGQAPYREFYVKWLNYGPEENSWEPEEGVGHLDLVKEFLEERKKKPAKREREPDRPRQVKRYAKEAAPSRKDEEDRKKRIAEEKKKIEEEKKKLAEKEASKKKVDDGDEKPGSAAKETKKKPRSAQNSDAECSSSESSVDSFVERMRAQREAAAKANEEREKKLQETSPKKAPKELTEQDEKELERRRKLKTRRRAEKARLKAEEEREEEKRRKRKREKKKLLKEAEARRKEGKEKVLSGSSGSKAFLPTEKSKDLKKTESGHGSEKKESDKKSQEKPKEDSTQKPADPDKKPVTVDSKTKVDNKEEDSTSAKDQRAQSDDLAKIKEEKPKLLLEESDEEKKARKKARKERERVEQEKLQKEEEGKVARKKARAAEKEAKPKADLKTGQTGPSPNPKKDSGNTQLDKAAGEEKKTTKDRGVGELFKPDTKDDGKAKASGSVTPAENKTTKLLAIALDVSPRAGSEEIPMVPAVPRALAREISPEIPPPSKPSLWRAPPPHPRVPSRESSPGPDTLKRAAETPLKPPQPAVAISNDDGSDDEDGEMYEIKRIVSDRWNSYEGDTEYLVEWDGYGSDEDTWEPEENLKHLEIFEEYKKKKETLSVKKKAVRKTYDLDDDKFKKLRKEEQTGKKSDTKSSKASTSRGTISDRVFNREPEVEEDAVEKQKRQLFATIKIPKKSQFEKDTGKRPLFDVAPAKSRTDADYDLSKTALKYERPTPKATLFDRPTVSTTTKTIPPRVEPVAEKPGFVTEKDGIFEGIPGDMELFKLVMDTRPTFTEDPNHEMREIETTDLSDIPKLPAADPNRFDALSRRMEYLFRTGGEPREGVQEPPLATHADSMIERACVNKRLLHGLRHGSNRVDTDYCTFFHRKLWAEQQSREVFDSNCMVNEAQLFVRFQFKQPRVQKYLGLWTGSSRRPVKKISRIPRRGRGR